MREGSGAAGYYTEFGDYTAWQSESFPRTRRRLEGNKLATEVKVQQLTAEPHPDPSLFTPWRRLTSGCEARPRELCAGPLEQYPLRGPVRAAGWEYTLKVVARENQSGKLGTFEQVLVLPETGGSGLGVSSVVVSNQAESLAASERGHRSAA